MSSSHDQQQQSRNNVESTSLSARDVVFAFFEGRGKIVGNTEREKLDFDYIDGVLLDSFGIVEMVTEIEGQLGIEFSTDDFQSPQFRTIGGLIEIIERRRGQQVPTE